MINLSIIRDLCEQKKITLKQLAKDVGITENGLQEIIKRNSTKTETLEKIAKTLGVDIVVFFKSDYTISESIPILQESDLKDKYIKLLEEKVEKFDKKAESNDVEVNKQK